MAGMKTTRYFREQVLRKRRRTGEFGSGKSARVREPRASVVTLADGETVHNAFPDRDFKAPAF
jgi:hypothetical protein